MQEIDVDTLAQLGDEIALIDVRERVEYEEAHVPGAVLVPLGEVMDRVDEIPEDRPVYLICRSGARSARAGAWLETQGRNTVNVAGGTQAWIDAGRDTVSGATPR